MKLDYCKDLWTNTVDYYWVDETDNLVKSPYFSSKEEAILWLQSYNGSLSLKDTS